MVEDIFVALGDPGAEATRTELFSGRKLWALSQNFGVGSVAKNVIGVEVCLDCFSLQP